MLLLCNDITSEYFEKEIWSYCQKILRMPVLTCLRLKWTTAYILYLQHISIQFICKQNLYFKHHLGK